MCVCVCVCVCVCASDTDHYMSGSGQSPRRPHSLGVEVVGAAVCIQQVQHESLYIFTNIYAINIKYISF